MVLRVPFQRSSEHEAVQICILIEHQSRVEALMRLRMLIYMGRLWESEYQQFDARAEGEQHWSPILPIVFYTGSDRWTEPRALTEILNVPRALAPFVPTFKILFLAESLIEQGKEIGIEQGAKETTIESILLFLDTRFEANTTETLKPTLEAIDDLQRLKHLLREAIRTQSLEAFTRTLTTPRNVL